MSDKIKEVVELIDSIRDATLEEAAKILERMVVGGRAWTEEQAIAADVLFTAAKTVRALKKGGELYEKFPPEAESKAGKESS